MLQQILIFASAYILTGAACAMDDIKRFARGPNVLEAVHILNIILAWPSIILFSSSDNRFIAQIILFTLVLGIEETIYYVW
ncbi:MAG TPA: hypothetical protein VM755_07930 [Stellaceae bacterium]|nr:hypothetical protein [Stellaceae bacterium]